MRRPCKATLKCLRLGHVRNECAPCVQKRKNRAKSPFHQSCFQRCFGMRLQRCALAGVRHHQALLSWHAGCMLRAPMSLANVRYTKPPQDDETRNPRIGCLATDYQEARVRMMDELLRPSIRDERVLSTMSVVPRHWFVPAGFREAAYEDGALPIGRGHRAFVTAPLLAASLLQASELEGKERVLEIGTGGGYVAALLGTLVAEVYTCDLRADLVEHVKQCLKRLGIDNVQVLNTDGSRGYAPAAPFDVILVPGAIPEVPQALLSQLNRGGRLLAPVGRPRSQSMLRMRRVANGFEREDLGKCWVEPLIGAAGFSGQLL